MVRAGTVALADNCACPVWVWDPNHDEGKDEYTRSMYNIRVKLRSGALCYAASPLLYVWQKA